MTQPISETYDSLQKGLLDGVLLPFEALKGFRLAELIKTSIENYGVSYGSSQYVVMNKKKWGSLTEKDRGIIEQINEEYIEKYAKLWNDLEVEAKEFSAKNGVKILKASKEEETAVVEKMKPILAAWAKRIEAKGLPAEEALRFCLDYIKTHP